MSAKSTGTGSSVKAGTKPSKPRPDFPLFPHASGKWAKTIKGKMYYFGKWDDPQGALDEYDEVKDDLHAGRAPKGESNGLTLQDLANQFIHAKRLKMEAGDLSPRTFIDYDRICRMLLDEFGKKRMVTDLRPADFQKLYGKLATKGHHAMAGTIVMTRGVFKYAYKNDLIQNEVKFGSLFVVPSAAKGRKARNEKELKHGKRMFQADEIKAMLGKASPQLRAMILLGINGALGNTDIANLPIAALDLDGGWLNYPRPKTGVNRRIPLWPESVEALRQVLAERKEPHDEQYEDLVFLTKYRQPWVRFAVVENQKFGKTEIKPKADDGIAKQTANLLHELGLKRHGVGFYALRHGFETIAGGSRDQVAVDAVMGHVDASMAAKYREGIDDARLLAVTDHVRSWLFGAEQEQQDESGQVQAEKPSLVSGGLLRMISPVSDTFK